MPPLASVYKENIDSIAALLETSLDKGLTEEISRERLKRDGKNSIQKTNPSNLWWRLIEQFSNLLVILLIIAAALSAYLGAYRDALVLFIIVLANAFIGFYQDWKSENVLSSIGHLLIEKCIVIRNGWRKEIPVNFLVRGDLVSLSEGDGVPADIRLIQSTGLLSNDFILTGESQPKEKNAQAHYTDDVSLADRDNCIYMGTTIAKGECLGIVYATGMGTELGKIAGSSMKIKANNSPLQKEMNTLAYKITLFTFVIGLLLFLFRLWQHDQITVSLVFAISIAAAMVPEGLPAQISIALSLGVQRLAQRKAIVKKLSSVETLGSATVIASDKTGTITKNEMTITFCHFDGHDYKITGTGFEPRGDIFDIDSNTLNKQNLGDRKIQFLSGYLASTAKLNPPDEFHQTWYTIGDPTESAFATLAIKAGYQLDDIDKDYEQKQLFPFDSIRKRMSIIRSHKGQTVSCVKGSIESVLQMSTHLLQKGNIIPMTESHRDHLLELAKSYAVNGLRIIAIAYRDLPTYQEAYTQDEAENGLTFSGFVTMMDPPNDSVKETITAAFNAHLRIIMITGDNEITAAAIADQIGMKNEDGSLPEIINDKQLRAIADDDLNTKLAQRSLIFSRVSPEEKLRIVSLLKERGDIVAVTGDGVNDTLSLKKADIGVAMGEKGSKIAQEAASMVLLDDNFSTIVFAIEEGRTIYKNIQKNVYATLSSNIAELTCVLFGVIGILFHMPAAILAIHILLIDLIGEMLPLLALSFDLPEKKVMQSHPRMQGQMLNTSVLSSILLSGLTRGMIAILVFFALYNSGAGQELHYEKAVTGTFITIIMTQFVHLLCMRTDGFVLNNYLFTNHYLFGGMMLSTFLMLLIIYLPLANQYLHTGPLAFKEWLYPLMGALAYLVLFEVYKIVRRKNPPYKHGISK